MSTDLVLLAALMAAVTYPSRALPLLVPGIDRLPRRALEYLQLVGPAVLAALAAVNVMVVTQDGQPIFHIGVEWLAVIVSIALTAWRRNLLYGLAAGLRWWPSPATWAGPEAGGLATPDGQRRASASISTRSDGSIRAATTTIDAAGRIAANRSPCAARTAGIEAGSVTYIRVRTTSARANPPSARARSMMSSAARACAPASPGWRDRPSGPASVVPDTQQPSPTTTARL